jgi:hypothetical protein
MTAKQLEKKVRNVDGVRIVVRAPANTKVLDYPFNKAAPSKWDVNEFLEKRIYPVLDGHKDVAVLTGSGADAHRGSHLKSLRASYRRWGYWGS